MEILQLFFFNIIGKIIAYVYTIYNKHLTIVIAGGRNMIQSVRMYFI